MGNGISLENGQEDGDSVSKEAEAAPYSSEEQSDRNFFDVQRAYLQGDWVTCEQALRHLLRYDKGDVEARLMLATLWRHLGRVQEAEKQLGRLERLEAASPWLDEITHEREQLQELLMAGSPNQTVRNNQQE